VSTGTQRTARLCLGEAGDVVGQLAYAKTGTREISSFVYEPGWLRSSARFSISPDLLLT